MELEQKLKSLIIEMSKQEESVKQHMASLKNDGICDEGLDSYLRSSLEDLKNRRESIIREFNLHNIELTQENKKSHPVASEIADVKTQQKSRPLHISFEKMAIDTTFKANPESIFKKKISPLRGNSPSALRYSPQLSPSSVRFERKQTYDYLSNTNSPPCSTRSSASSMDKLLGTASLLDSFKSDLFKKYQEQREKRNQAHEEMLSLKEIMLKEKEKKLESIVKLILKKEKKSNNDNELFQNQANNDDLQVFNKNKQYVKPPRSPRITHINNKADSKSMQPDNKIVRFI